MLFIISSFFFNEKVKLKINVTSDFYHIFEMIIDDNLHNLSGSVPELTNKFSKQSQITTLHTKFCN